LHFEVYNRWGQKVFISNGVNAFWDGNLTNELKCNAGVYYYVVTYTDFCNQEFSEKGFIHLMR